MLARSGVLPTRPGWSFEPKWDGFRAIVRIGNDYCVRSRRGWLMTELLPEFATLPVRGVFDGELVAFDTDGRPSFHRVCARMLHRDASVPVALILFDVLELNGAPTLRLPYRERHELLESLTFGNGCHLCPRFEDGTALWRSVVERRLEGVVAKRLSEPYRPGERLWIKKKNPGWPRYEAEREAVIRDPQRRARPSEPTPGR
jgi:bifunctional non-homologous end joining protein LigD